jgi:hypothetical protein
MAFTNSDIETMSRYANWLVKFGERSGDKKSADYIRVDKAYNALRDLQEAEPTTGEKATAYFGGASEMTAIPQVVAGAGNALEYAGADNVGKAVREAGYLMGGLSPEGQYNLNTVPQREGGRTLGSSIVGYGPFGTAARLRGVAPTTQTTPNLDKGGFFASPKVERTMAPIISQFQKNPLKAPLVETAISVPVSGATIASVDADPNNPGLRALSEFGTGFSSGVIANKIAYPFRLGADGIKSLSGTLTRFKDSLTPEGRRSAAGKVISRVIGEGGEDYDAILRSRDAGISGGSVGTAAQTAQSPSLVGLEKLLAKGGNDAFGVNVRGKGEQEVAKFTTQLDKLVASGRPELIKIAAQERKKFVDSRVDKVLERAESKAEAALLSLRDGEGDKSAISVQARGVINNAIKTARKQESEIWGTVSQTEPIDATPLVGLRKQLIERGRILPTEELPSVLQAAIRRMKKQVKAAEKTGEVSKTKSGDILKFRSRILNLERESRVLGKFNDASIYREYADGALASLDGLPGTDMARQFSRSLNDKLTRSVIADITKSRLRGGDPVRPETTLEKVISGSPQKSAAASDELIEGVTPVQMGDETLDMTNPKNMQTLMGEFANAAAVNTLKNGQVDPNALRTFTRANSKLLQQYPQLLDIVTNAGNTKRALDIVTKRVTGLRESINSGILGKLLSTENPDAVVTEALKVSGSKTPVKNMSNLAIVARRGGQEATSGLKSSVINHIASNADPSATFNNPLSRTQPSIKQLMVSNKLMNKDQAEAFGILLDGMQRAKTSAAMSSDGGIATADVEVLGKQDRIVDIFSRWLGAAISTSGPMNTQAQGLVIAGAGARQGQEMVMKQPMFAIRETIKEILLDPQLTRQVLKEARPYKPAPPIAGMDDLELKVGGMLSRYVGTPIKRFIGITPMSVRPTITPGITAELFAGETENVIENR